MVLINDSFRWHPKPEHNAPDWARHLAQFIALRMDLIMASIADLTAVAQAVSDGVTRVDADLQALKDAVGNVTNLSPEDQAALDAAVAQLQGSVDAINTTDPAPAPPAA